MLQSSRFRKPFDGAVVDSKIRDAQLVALCLPAQPVLVKTLLSKALAEFMFGDGEALVCNRHVRIHGET